jgi:hypothetical protein
LGNKKLTKEIVKQTDRRTDEKQLHTHKATSFEIADKKANKVKQRLLVTFGIYKKKKMC